MIQHSFYHIQADLSNGPFLAIEWTFTATESGTIPLQLPIWRPGRYQAQHFAKNIPKIYQKCEGELVPVQKLGGSTWQVEAKQAERIHLVWQYYAKQEDAGGSVAQDDFLYINFITCCLYVPGYEEQVVEVQLSYPSHWQSLTALEHKLGQTYTASSFRQLVDSPFMAAPHLNIVEWEEGNILFKAGGLDPLFAIDQKIIKAYKTFTAYQLRYMGDFPSKQYVYMHWICPKPYYHGVEHSQSTMIVLGPPERDLYEDLIGVASHELFHVWNVCSIRPKELLPYQYDREVIFPSGGVVEGITTYLGDWFLFASGVWTAEEYLAGLEGNLKLHYERDFGNAQSLVESSLDLWLDGYGDALPGKRVSIYYKGALVALGLDLLIRKKFDHGKSIRQVMLRLNTEFGHLQKGYTLSDFYRICSEVYEDDLEPWFARWMESNADVTDELKELLRFVGVELIFEEGKLSLSGVGGIGGVKIIK